MKKILTTTLCGIGLLGLTACNNVQNHGTIGLGESYIDEGIIGITNEQLFAKLTEIHPELRLDTMTIQESKNEDGYVTYYANPVENVMIHFYEVEKLDEPKYESSIGTLYDIDIVYEKEGDAQQYVSKLMDGMNQIIVQDLLKDDMLEYGQGFDDIWIDYYRLPEEEIQELWSDEAEDSKKVVEILERAGIDGSKPIYQISI